MSYQIQRDGRLVRIILAGQVTITEISNLSHEMADLDAGLETVPDRLTDLSAVEKDDINYAAMERLGKERQARVYRNKFRSAIVAPSPLGYGMARMFQALSVNPQIERQIFKTRAEAEEWLASGK